MKRLLAGIFDPAGRAECTRLADALTPSRATVVRCGPLHVAFSGPVCPAREPLCLFDGFLDNAADVAHALGRPEVDEPETLIACAYRRWGGDLLRRLRGDFALLVWDSLQGEGLIARDQLGVRSMFLHDGPGGLCFAGEIGQLLALLPTRPAPDPEGVASWIVARGRPGSGTLYAGVRRLDPGAVLLLGRGATRQHRYWTPRFVDPLDVSQPELDGIVRESIGRAVRRRLSAGGITGVMMSGGLDSSSVAAVAAVQAPGRVAACS
ncbi:MAG TPA: asparagine synthase-related protein, partial [Solirubrobacteraceae bacterium]|nr:asparagine synthase-related protein [Solirubrobacteraceae bacterium]